MNQMVLDSASQRDRVQRIIVAPLKGRGNPPHGWTEESMFSDYVEVLGRFSEATLRDAVRRVKSTHLRPTWPLASEYAKACEDMTDYEPKRPTGDDDTSRSQRSAQAWAYVQARENANDGALLIRAMTGAWIQDLRLYLFNHACDDIRAGRAPYIPNDILEREILGWIEDGKARLRSRAQIRGASLRSANEKVLHAIKPLHIQSPETLRRVEEAKRNQ